RFVTKRWSSDSSGGRTQQRGALCVCRPYSRKERALKLSTPGFAPAKPWSIGRAPPRDALARDFAGRPGPRRSTAGSCSSASKTGRCQPFGPSMGRYCPSTTTFCCLGQILRPAAVRCHLKKRLVSRKDQEVVWLSTRQAAAQ